MPGLTRKRTTASGRAGRRAGPPSRTAGAVASLALLVPLLASAPSATAEQPSHTGLRQAFTDAAERYDVPRDVLLGVAYLQSRWDAHRGAPSVGGGYGPMHLTDVVTALASTSHHAQGSHHGEGEEDPRGDGARAPKWVAHRASEPPGAGAPPARLRTVERARHLTGLTARELREDPAANVHGGAALLAAAQKRLGLPPSRDPARWYAAVADYAGAADTATARMFADEVYAVLRTGASRRTDTGERMRLAPHPGLRPDSGTSRRLALPAGDRAPGVECPPELACESVPAPYQELGDGDYGNHDKALRPASQRIDYIVVHDTEGYWDTALKLVRDPTYVSWHYTLRASDGHVAQHVPTRDIGWHAGNWYVNAKSVGLEHEGFLTAPDAWYTEAMYRSSARLVRHLARRYAIPLDRQHILGHDTVPGTVASTIRGMHTDPGPYWDWAHYFRLLGAPLRPTAGPEGGLVTIRPDYDRHQPVYTDCEKAGRPCAPHGSGAVRLHTAPRADAPLVRDVGLRPDGSPTTTGVNDTGARASTGQRFAVAGRSGEWTAIWYLGQRAWFHDPARQPTAVPARGWVVTPRPGRAEVPVYGRAYPEKAAYPQGVPVQEVSPLPYTLERGQRYVVGLRTRGEYLWATTFDPAGHRVVRGADAYYQIQFGHRVAFVRAADVSVRPSGR
ncbi:N-acetylmuramoyl-L-alanine amidase [Streptomyces sp. NPDC057702]|uniref:N-acetylmuramoyl-L-alanine amidase n=1 Tax=unclassified Streptomyces TaxID=2593676 RepID=UPI003679EEB3